MLEKDPQALMINSPFSRVFKPSPSYYSDTTQTESLSDLSTLTSHFSRFEHFNSELLFFQILLSFLCKNNAINVMIL